MQIYSADGALIGEFGEKRRRPVHIEDVPQPFIDALLAAEDAEFYSHKGVSIKGLARAVTELLLTGERGSGGSTLTMQLTRNVFLSLDRKFIRKFNEILLSLKLERELSKDEILELYVNYMFLGKRAYGIQAAAEVYYGKELSDLSLAQLAMIAGLFQGPSTQNPIVNPKRAVERRNWILGRMLTLKMIDQAAYDGATAEGVSARYHGSQLDARAPYVAELARTKAIRSYGTEAYTKGYKVYTTVNAEMQIAAQRAVRKGLLTYDQRHGWRGAELNLATQVISNENNADNTSKQINLDQETKQAWIDRLRKIDDFEGLMPAAVTQIEEKSIALLNRQGDLIELKWDEGPSDMRPYISENRQGAKYKSPAEMFRVGDVIRVIQQKDRSWRLSQLPSAQAALVALDPNNGGILAIVGGFSFYQSKFNRATQAKRQPGSNFKPFLYTAALENGMTAATLINDSPLVFNDEELENTWRPKNDGGKFYGDMRLREALYRSRNLVSIRILQQLGINTALKSFSRFGFDIQALPRDLSLALGTQAVPPMEMATAWASFANGGYKISPHLIQRITDTDGNIIYEALPATVCSECDEATNNNYVLDVENGTVETDIDYFELPLEFKRELGWLEPSDYPRAERIIGEQVAFIMDDILKDVIRRGTGRRARALERSDIAGKTGTTNGPLDAWFSGYNPDVIATTWVGFDQNTPLGNREYGGSAALPIWMDFMRVALKNSPDRPRKQPPGIVTVRIDPETGLRARANDPDARFEFFRVNKVPRLIESSDIEEPEKAIETFAEEIF
ncbi:penicillin-binding protein 1A [Agaribacterium haliotis]|uniref:penicillin-binding protein 1A n=1 Tax=Agaribacterium haliotis TaxID=2013869 RepID=UPI001304323C|nr:PBP1A family penicillin-binding protein [Agaribacterium haliotis]